MKTGDMPQKKKSISCFKKEEGRMMEVISAQIIGEIDTNVGDRRLQMFKLELELLCLRYNLLVEYCINE